MASVPPFALAGIDHVVLPVRRLGESLAFYCGVLGCTVDREQPHVALTQLRAGTSLIDLIDTAVPAGAWAASKAPGGKNMEHFCLAIGSVDKAALHRHLADNGIAVVEEGVRYGAIGSTHSIYIRDPDGNNVELKLPA